MSKPDLTLREMWAPSGKVSAYFPIFWQHLTQDTTATQKVGIAAVMMVWEYFTNSLTVPAVVALCLFGLDWTAGTIRAIRDPDEELRWERAADGVLKFFLYLVIFLTAVLVEVLVVDSTIELDPNGTIVSVALGIIIWMELTSIRDNVTAGIPESRPFFRRAFEWLPWKPPAKEPPQS